MVKCLIEPEEEEEEEEEYEQEDVYSLPEVWPPEREEVEVDENDIVFPGEESSY